MNAIVGLRQALGDVPVAVDPATIRLKSRDFFWFSPILKPLLDAKRANLVAFPRNKGEVMKVAAACARFRLPLTLRGGGTGNYGQAVPLEGGVVLDMTALDRTIRVVAGAGRFEAGARLLEIDRMLHPKGWELRFHPSTRSQATIGGFVAGGAAGAGSCTWGQIADRGAVIAVEVMTVEEQPRLIELRGGDVLKVLHAYGVNGIITEVEVPLAPLHPWAERIATFPTLGAASRFGYALTAAEGIAKKEVCILDGRIPAYLKRLAPLAPAGEAMALLMVSEPQSDALAELVAAHGGRVVFARNAADAEAAAFEVKGDFPPLYEYAWNHTTLHALRVDPRLTYLQVRFPSGREIETVEAIESAFGDEMLLHLEFQRRAGRVFLSALPLVRFSTPERLTALMEEIAALGGDVSNPHSYLLDNAGWKRIEAPQPEFKAVADPYGLMNPGKLKAWPPAQ